MIHPSASPQRWRFVRALLIFVAITLAVGAIGGAVTSGPVATWYPTLNKPEINPPDWVFAPVWTTLYLMMALAAAIVWIKADHARRRAAMAWFSVQLALNLAWSVIFFGLQQIGLAILCLGALWIAILITARLFWSIAGIAGLLFVPYLAWVTFAGVLNLLIWRLN